MSLETFDNVTILSEAELDQKEIIERMIAQIEKLKSCSTKVEKEDCLRSEEFRLAYRSLQESMDMPPIGECTSEFIDYLQQKVYQKAKQFEIDVPKDVQYAVRALSQRIGKAIALTSDKGRQAVSPDTYDPEWTIPKKREFLRMAIDQENVAIYKHFLAHEEKIFFEEISYRNNYDFFEKILEALLDGTHIEGSVYRFFDYESFVRENPALFLRACSVLRRTAYLLSSEGFRYIDLLKGNIPEVEDFLKVLSIRMDGYIELYKRCVENGKKDIAKLLKQKNTNSTIAAHIEDHDERVKKYSRK